jgi:hypothetical protein
VATAMATVHPHWKIKIGVGIFVAKDSLEVIKIIVESGGRYNAHGGIS